MAVPKTKVSKSRKNMRRSSVWKLETPALSKCTNCSAFKTPHRVCKECGFYKGRHVVVAKQDDE